MSDIFHIESYNDLELVRLANETPDCKPVGPMLQCKTPDGKLYIQVMQRVRKPVGVQLPLDMRVRWEA